MKLRTHTVFAFFKAHLWALAVVVIIFTCSLFTHTASSIGAAFIIGVTAFLLRRRAQLPVPLIDMPPRTLIWQVAVLLALIVLEQTWAWLQQPGLPKDPVWLNSNWVDISMPQSRIFTWQTVIRLGVTAILVGVLSWLFRDKPRDLGLVEIRPAWRWTGQLVFFAVYSSLVLMGLILALHNEIRLDRINPMAMAAAILMAFIGAGLREELLYRLLLQTRLEALLGSWNGIFLAGLIFGLVHTVGTYRTLGGVLGQAIDLDILLKAAAASTLQQGVGGIIYGYLWSRFRNGWLMVLQHGTLDSLSLITLTLVRGIQLG